MDNYPNQEKTINNIKEDEKNTERTDISNPRICPFCGGWSNKGQKQPNGKQAYRCKRCKKYNTENISCVRVRYLSQEERKEYILNQKRISRNHRAEKFQVLRQKAIMNLGGCCNICGKKGRLELHHLTYSNGDPYNEFSKPTASKMIVKEALEYPENFALLCSLDHGIITRILRYKEKIVPLII